MHLIERMLAPVSSNPPEDRLELAVERRKFLKRRWRGTAPDGTEFGFDLESRLVDGCVIFQENGIDYIVRQLPEACLRNPFFRPRASIAHWLEGRQPPPPRPSDEKITPHPSRSCHEATARTRILAFHRTRSPLHSDESSPALKFKFKIQTLMKTLASAPPW